jgi:FAD/FMN-containing dehydrogenase
MEKAIKALQDAFTSDQVVPRGTETFDKINKSYLSLLLSELTPAAIFLPREKHDIVKFVRLISPFVLDDDVQIAIRGAGQQPAPRCSNIGSLGITIDLRNLNNIEIKEGVVSLGAGARWGTIYEKLGEQGLGVTGSRSGLGGIGGLALSGRIN